MAHSSPPSCCSLASFSSSCRWRLKCGSGADRGVCEGEERWENRIRSRQGRQRGWRGWGTGITQAYSYPSACPRQTFPEHSLLIGTSIPYSLLRGSSFWGWHLKGQSPPPTALCLFFPLEKEKGGKRESEEEKKEAVSRPIRQTSIIPWGWGGETRSQEGCSKVPGCLLKCWRVFCVYSNIINVMGKSYFLINNLHPDETSHAILPRLL